MRCSSNAIVELPAVYEQAHAIFTCNILFIYIWLYIRYLETSMHSTSLSSNNKEPIRNVWPFKYEASPYNARNTIVEFPSLSGVRNYIDRVKHHLLHVLSYSISVPIDLFYMWIVSGSLQEEGFIVQHSSPHGGLSDLPQEYRLVRSHCETRRLRRELNSQFRKLIYIN